MTVSDSNFFKLIPELSLRFCAVALDESSIAILGGEVPTSDGIAISAEMKTYNIDNADWTSQPGKYECCGTRKLRGAKSVITYILIVNECCVSFPILPVHTGRISTTEWKKDIKDFRGFEPGSTGQKAAMLAPRPRLLHILKKKI